MNSGGARRIFPAPASGKSLPDLHSAQWAAALERGRQSAANAKGVILTALRNAPGA